MKKIILIVLDVLIIVGLALFGGYYFQKYQHLKKNPPSADQVAKQQQQDIIDKVSKLYGSLPKDETPTVATVNDKDASVKQYGAFFDKAQNGDVTLLYTKAKLAILYRPSTNQLINVSTLNIQNSPVVKVYGPGRKAAEDKLTTAKIPNADGGDSKSTPSNLTVVDISSKNADLAKQIADALGGQVGSLPSGEDKPAGVDVAVYAP